MFALDIKKKLIVTVKIRRKNVWERNIQLFWKNKVFNTSVAKSQTTNNNCKFDMLKALLELLKQCVSDGL